MHDTTWISEDLFRAVFDHSMDAMLITSPDGRVHAANAEACRLFGLSEAEIIASGREQLVDMSDPRLSPLMELRARTGAARGELRLRRKSGSTWVPFEGQLASRVFCDASGRQLTVMLLRDITAVKHGEMAAARLAAIVEGSNDAIVSKSLDGTIDTWNRAAEDLYGYSAAEVVGQPVAQLFPPESQDDSAVILETIRCGGRVERRDGRRLTKDGRIIDVEVTVSPIRDRDGRVIGASTIAHDVSQRRQAEREREELVSQLQSALGEVKTLSRLLPICAHCKKVRDEAGEWTQFESYLAARSEAKFSHSICPDCARTYFGDYIGGENRRER